MNPLTLSKKMLASRYLCDNCLGRQFAQLLSGYSNEDRGKTIRMMLALDYEIKPFRIKSQNIDCFKFRTSSLKTTKKEGCWVCDDLFKKLDKLADKVIPMLANYKTFLIGSRASDLTEREERLWSKIGIQYCEPIRSEINRELGKLIWKKTKKPFEEKRPEATAIVDLDRNIIEVVLASLFISGGYKKLKRGLPQTKWEMYKETVEDIISRPVMKAAKGTEHAMHAAGREDIDARCLDWRPFVLEIKKPKTHRVNLKKLAASINRSRKVKVNNLKISNKQDVVHVKSMRSDKEYRALVAFEKPIINKDINRLSKLKTTIKQKTPERVRHRRADKVRNRKVKSIKWKKIKDKTFEFTIKGEAGLYIKELITGDNGRTRPSVSEILKTRAKVKELDVIKIYK